MPGTGEALNALGGGVAGLQQFSGKAAGWRELNASFCVVG